MQVSQIRQGWMPVFKPPIEVAPGLTRLEPLGNFRYHPPVAPTSETSGELLTQQLGEYVQSGKDYVQKYQGTSNMDPFYGSVVDGRKQVHWALEWLRLFGQRERGICL